MRDKENRLPENGAGRRNYDGTSCPYHTDMCKQVRSKVPIWVLTLFITGVLAVSTTFGGLAWKSLAGMHKELSGVGKTVVEIQTNQKILMNEFNIRRYEDTE